VVKGRIRFGARRVQIGTLVRPHALLFIGVLLSFLAWALPWGNFVPRGFPKREPVTFSGSLLLAGWYVFFFIIAWGGFRLGRRIKPSERAERVSAESYYLYFTLLAVIGVVYSYGYIALHDSQAISNGLFHQQFNEVRKVLPESAGVQTLRYASCLSGGIAIFELGRRRVRWLHLVNIALLVLATAVAARILLIIAVIVAVGLTAQHLDRKGISLRRVVVSAAIGAAALFLALTPFNYFRNAGSYRDVYGVHNPFLMNLDEVIRYLGMPFQASIAVANHVHSWPKLPSEAASGLTTYMLPTYAQPATPPAVAQAELKYRTVTTIVESQTTNSVLAATYGVFGLATLAIIGFVAFVAAILAGHASRYVSYVSIASFVIAYCFAEFWRVYAFNAGVVQFLVGATALWGIVGASVDGRASGRWVRFEESVLAPLQQRRSKRSAPPIG